MGLQLSMAYFEFSLFIIDAIGLTIIEAYCRFALIIITMP